VIVKARINAFCAHRACHVCGQELPVARMRFWATVRPGVSALIAKAHPGWAVGAVIWQRDLLVFRRVDVEQLLARRYEALGDLEHQVLERLQSGKILSQHLLDKAGCAATLGERAADRVAAFGDSWTFILWLTAVLFVWIAANAAGILPQPFDPCPFILLNLVLSSLAALQAPVIMMSQRRQETKVRLRAQNDDMVNLKAEREIRQLHEKIDHHLAQRRDKRAALQQIQTELLEERLDDRH
jgi:uncharacterized membrane protein